MVPLAGVSSKRVLALPDFDSLGAALSEIVVRNILAQNFVSLLPPATARLSGPTHHTSE